MQRYVVIEGPLGVGKTSLTRMLAEKMNGEALIENVEENPFLPRFYQNPKRYAFQTQIFFLLRRYRHAMEIAQTEFNRPKVSDFLFDKDQIFAKVNLDENEYPLYEQIFQILKKRIAPPDLVIFLQAKTEVLMERIRNRNRRYERPVSLKYIEKVNRAFNDYFFHFTDCPLLVVNASEIDFVHVPADFEDLVQQIGSMKSGTQYYIPMSSKG